MTTGDKDQESQVAIQFLDCVHQLWCQHMMEFEFNLDLLWFLAYHMYSGAFGNLVFNNARERLEKCCATKSLSCWSFIMSNKKSFINSLFNPQKKLIHAKYREKQLRVWDQYFYSLDDTIRRSQGQNNLNSLQFPVLDRSVSKVNAGFGVRPEAAARTDQA